MATTQEPRWKTRYRTDFRRHTLTVTEAAAVLGMPRSTAYQAVKTGEIPSLVIGGRYYVSRYELERMLGGPVVVPESVSNSSDEEVEPGG